MKKLIIASVTATALLTLGAFAQENKEVQTKKEDKKITFTQIGNKMICPITGEEFLLQKNTPKIGIDGKTYYFCCKNCIEKFKKDYKKPETPLTDLDTANEVICPVMGTKFVPNSKSPKAEYKGKTYYFCCPECVEKFNKEPEKYITMKNKETKHKHQKGKMCNSCDEHKTETKPQNNK